MLANEPVLSGDAAMQYLLSLMNESAVGLHDDSAADASQEAFMDAADTVAVRLTTATAAVGVAAVLLNFTFLTLICIHHKMFWKRIFYRFVANFVVADIIAGIFVIIQATHLMAGGIQDAKTRHHLMRLHQFATMVSRVCHIVVIMNLLTITCNEYLFICHAIYYRQWVTKGRQFGVVVFMWISSVAVGAAWVKVKKMEGSRNHVIIRLDNATFSEIVDNGSMNIGDHVVFPSDTDNGRRLEPVDIFSLIMLIFTTVCIAIILYCFVQCMKDVTRIQRQDVSLHREARRMSMPSVEDGGMGHQSDPHDDVRILRRHKYVMILGLVIVSYLLYLLMFVGLQVTYWFVRHNENSFHTVIKVHRSILFLSVIHAAIRPLFYLRKRELRAVVKRLLYQLSLWHLFAHRNDNDAMASHSGSIQGAELLNNSSSSQRRASLLGSEHSGAHWWNCCSGCSKIRRNRGESDFNGGEREMMTIRILGDAREG